jgi:hypothetical protein
MGSAEGTKLFAERPIPVRLDRPMALGRSVPRERWWTSTIRSAGQAWRTDRGDGVRARQASEPEVDTSRTRQATLMGDAFGGHYPDRLKPPLAAPPLG